MNNQSIKYNSSCNMLFKMLSERIRIRRDQMSLTNKDLCPVADPKLVSAIVNNRRDDKKNKYLIPDGTKGTYKSDNDIPFVDIIATNLLYTSSSELLIGSSEELDNYSGYLFAQIILDAINDETEEVTKVIEDILADYIPYAKASAYYKLTENIVDTTRFMIDPQYHFSIDEYTNLQKKAIARCYTYINADFRTLIENLFTSQPNTLKLNQRLSKMVITELIPVMNRNRHTNSLIINARRTISENYEKLIYYTNYELGLSPETVGYHENDIISYERYNINDWTNAELDYINKLEEIQLNSESEPDISLLNNSWNGKMCIKNLPSKYNETD